MSLDPSDASRLSELVERLGAVLGAEARQQAAALGLPLVQREALRYLARCNRYSDTPAAVSDYLGLTRGTVSQTLNALERQGLIEKVPDPADGRVVHCRLTRAAKPHLGPARSGVLEAARALEPRAVAQAAETLEALLRELQRRRGGRAFGVCRTCAHFRRPAPGKFQCGLTGEPLRVAETERLCREHTLPAAT